MNYLRFFVLGIIGVAQAIGAASAVLPAAAKTQVVASQAKPLASVNQSDRDCAALADSVEEGVKTLSFLSTPALSTRGEGPTRAMERVEVAITIQANLTVMLAHRCPIPARTISDTAYAKDAATCAAALAPRELFGNEHHDAKSCSRSSWLRDK